MKRQAIKSAALAVSANAEFFVTLCAYALLVLVASRKWDIPISLALYDQTFALFGAAVTVALLVYLIAKTVLIDKPNRPFEHLWRSKFCLDWKMPERLTIGLPVALVMPIFFSLFTSVKASINTIVPFYADPFFASADRIVSGNSDAWLILQPFIGFPVVTFALNFVYNLWFIIMITTLFCVTFLVGDLRLRSQYLVAFVLVWAILGNAMAVVFSSVGPCFYEFFYGLPRYADLMEYLHTANRDFPIWSLIAQNYLLNANDAPHIGAGISAFPSLHVAVAMLNVMLCRHLRRLWQIASILFLILILIGSVQLGWHYAVDGYFSIIVVPAIWWVAGKVSLVNVFKRVVPDPSLHGSARYGGPLKPNRLPELQQSIKPNV